MKNTKDLIHDFLSAYKDKNAEEKNVGKFFPQKLGEFSISIPCLLEDYPPRYNNAYKRKLWSQINHLWHDGKIHIAEGKITASQYKGHDCNFKLEKQIDSEIDSIDYYFDYKESDKDTTRWYLNFADPNLFVAYGSDLFAQDEIQCLEHPLLGSLKEYMTSSDIASMSEYTINGNCPTPILIEDVPYMVEVKTTFDFDGIAYSIYGNAFRRAELNNPDILDMGIHVKDTVTLSNIIAMCAPYPESGQYRKETIQYLLMCALTAFGAAKDRTQSTNIEIHTGRWGAGAFGGNEELAIIVQILAANICGISSLVFHAVSPEKLNAAKSVCKTLFETTKGDLYFSDIVHHLFSLEYDWGVSDGN